MKECPACGTENPNNAAQCDCGHEFPSLREYLAERRQSMESAVTPAGGMFAAGWLFLILGGFLLWLALTMDTSVATDTPYSSSPLLGELALPKSVSNISLMQQQMMALHAGLAAFGLGSILIAMASVVSWISRKLDGQQSHIEMPDYA